MHPVCTLMYACVSIKDMHVSCLYAHVRMCIDQGHACILFVRSCTHVYRSRTCMYPVCTLMYAYLDLWEVSNRPMSPDPQM